jgi:hypothetical protein
MIYGPRFGNDRLARLDMALTQVRMREITFQTSFPIVKATYLGKGLVTRD